MRTPIPIVFIVSNDPVRLGLVASIARPDGNLTGINSFTGELEPKGLELRAPARAMRNSAPR
jgi:putative tryptophan/tyrosine transport system substrate-binding protein